MSVTKVIHPVAGAAAIITILMFWLSTVLSELFASERVIIAVKTSIPWGFLILIPALAAVGGSGFKLSKGRLVGIVGKKAKRMPFIAANGILVLIPSAFFLSYKASHAEFDVTFFSVQALELIVGATNIFLLYLNMRDGLKIRNFRRNRSL